MILKKLLFLLLIPIFFPFSFKMDSSGCTRTQPISTTSFFTEEPTFFLFNKILGLMKMTLSYI